jgi:hypothetical protein
MTENSKHIGSRISTVDAGSTTIRFREYSLNGHLSEVSFCEFDNPVTHHQDSRIIYPLAWDALAKKLACLGQNSDLLVITGALKNPAHFQNDAGHHHQILGRFDPKSSHQEVNGAIKEACGHEPKPGQEHYAAVKCAVVQNDPHWEKHLGVPGHVGSRIGAFAAAALGMTEAFIAEPDIPGFTLNSSNLATLERVMASFNLQYETRPQRFNHRGTEVYTAGDVTENSQFFHHLINRGLIDPHSRFFEGDTYFKLMYLQEGHMHYQKEAMGAGINPMLTGLLKDHLDQNLLKKDPHYAYRFVADQACSKMHLVNYSPYYLLNRQSLTLVAETAGSVRPLSPEDLPRDLDSLGLIAASCFVSAAANMVRHLPAADFDKTPPVHLYSGMFRRDQAAGTQAFCGVLPDNTDVYLDIIPDSAGVAVLNACLKANQDFDLSDHAQLFPCHRPPSPGTVLPPTRPGGRPSTLTSFKSNWSRSSPPAPEFQASSVSLAPHRLTGRYPVSAPDIWRLLK